MKREGPSPHLATLAKAIALNGRAPDLDAGEWPVLIELAERHRVVSLLAAACAGHALPSREIALELAQRRLANHARERRSEAALAQIAAALDSARLWFVVLKGASVARRFYEVPGDRNAVDIDILVRENDIGPATGALRALDYEGVGAAGTLSGPPGAAFRAASADLEFLRHADRTRLELHWRLSRNRQFPPFCGAALEARVEPFAGSHGPLPGLAPAALLVHLVCHGARHLWFRLKWLADIDRVAGSLSPADLAESATLARELGCERAYHTSLDLAQRCFGTPLAGTFDPALVSRALLRAMLRALEDDIAVRENYGLRDLPLALSNAYGRFLLRPSLAYRRELLRHTLVDASDAHLGWPRAALRKVGRKARLPV